MQQRNQNDMHCDKIQREKCSLTSTRMFSKNSSESLKIQRIYKISTRNEDLLFSRYSNNPGVSNVF